MLEITNDKMLKPLTMLKKLCSSATNRTPTKCLKRNKSFTVCIEGNIGSGKTTFLEHFKKFSNIIETNGEPVQKWREFHGYNPLAQLYESPQRWCYTVQMFMLLTLMELHTKPQTKPVRMMERSVYSSRYCFVENQHKNKLMNEMEYLMLAKWFDWLMTVNDVKIDLIVYLRTDPETVFERVMARQRPEEKAIPLKLLQELHNYHEQWLIERKTFPVPAPILVVDANKDKASMLKTFKDIKSKVLFGYDSSII